MVDGIQRKRDRWSLPPTTAQKKQQELITLALSGEVDQILFGGAVGGGKSWACARLVLERAKAMPGSKHLVIRETFPELSQAGGLIPTVRGMLGARKGWSETYQRWVLPGDTWIQFGHCHNLAAAGRYWGSEYETLIYDEVTQLPVDVVMQTNIRCRSKMGYPCLVVYATNPIGRSAYYFRDKFYNAWLKEGKPQSWRRMEEVVGEKVWITRAYLPSRLEDNKYLDRETYLRTLSGLPPHIAQALVEGRWDVITGQYYMEFSPEVHVEDPVKEVPEGWQVNVGLDYGFNNPCGIVWGGMDYDGVLHIFHEARVRRKEVPEVASLIHRTNERYRVRPVRYGTGPDLFSLSGRVRGGPRDEEVFRQSGIPLDNVAPGHRGKADKFSNFRRWLSWCGEDGEPVPGKPLLRISRDCEYLIGQIQEAQIDEDDPEMVLDSPADSEGHGGDDVRDAAEYLCMTRPFRLTAPKVDDREPRCLEWYLEEGKKQRWMKEPETLW